MTAPTWVNSATFQAAGNQTSFAATLPTSLTVGNLMVALVVLSNPSGTVSAPGWTADSMASSSYGQVLWRRVDGTESTTATFTDTTASALSAFKIVQLSGVVATGNPVDGITSGLSPGTTTGAALSVTTTGADRLLLYQDTTIVAATLVSAPSGMTLDPTAGSTDAVRLFYGAQASSGSSGSKQDTLSSGQTHLNIMLAIAPGAGDYTGPANTTAVTSTQTATGATGKTTTAVATAITAAIVAAGTVAAPGAANPTTVTAATSASGVVGRSTDSSTTVTAATSGTGQVGKATSAAATISVGLTASGFKSSSTTSTTTVTAATSASGVASGNTLAFSIITANITASGNVATGSATTRLVTATLTAAAFVGTQNTANRTITATVTSSGLVSFVSTASLPIGVTTSAEGFVDTGPDVDYPATRNPRATITRNYAKAEITS